MRKFSIGLKSGLCAMAVMFCLNVNAQQGNSYEDFSTEALKSNEKYTWNFNPIDYEPEILVSCIVDVLNLARQKYNAAQPLVSNEKLGKAARMQAESMAKKEEKTQENAVKSLKTPEMRAVKAGGSRRVTELVTRVKATRGSGGSEDYSYLDLATEVVSSLLKNKKAEGTVLSKTFSYVGVDGKPDRNNKNCYVSVVFGNDLSFNKENLTYKNTTYTRKLYGLQRYSEKTCRRCQVRNIELMQQNIVVKGNDIYFTHPNVRALKRLIGKKGDAIAIDIVQHSQYDCGKSNDIDFNLQSRRDAQTHYF